MKHINEKQELINEIRSEYSDLKDSPRVSLYNSVKQLSEDLYSKDMHFIFEIIQNAEDNTYHMDKEPEISFTIKEIQLYDKEQVVLIIENNEIGFEHENVRSICKVGDSTKKGKKQKGYIGEKGIGFKSVFKISECPHIFSNGYRFCLPKEDKETGLGYIVPQWIEPLNFVDNKKTTIILPLYENVVDDTIRSLKEISPETILFLTKLKSLNIIIDLNENYEILISKNDKNSPVVEITSIINKDEDIQTSKYWCGKHEVLVPDYVTTEKRKGFQTSEITIALPLNAETSYPGKLFAYLPVWDNIELPFLINADFLLTSSREGILEDESWNIWLRNELIKVYVLSFMNCLKSDLLREDEKYSIYASIPTEDPSKEFLSRIKEEVISALKVPECVYTEPDGNLYVPEKTRTAIKKFRELLDGYSYPKYLKSTPIVRQGLEKFKDQLYKLDVKSLSSYHKFFEDTSWLELHDYHWLIQSYLFFMRQKISDLSTIPIVPVDDEKKIRWTCDSEQPIYFECNQEHYDLLTSIPEDIREMFPVVFLDNSFLKLIENHKKYKELKEWMTEQLEIYDLDIENFCVDILSKLTQNYQNINTVTLIELTDFLIDNAANDFSWKKIPIVLSTNNIIINDKEEKTVVVPQDYDKECGWQNIWKTEEDRSHFVSLHIDYSEKAIKKFFDRKIVKLYPRFEKVNYTNSSECATKIEGELLEWCRKEAAQKRRNEVYVESIIIPTTLRNHVVEQSISGTIIELFKKRIINDTDLNAKGHYHYRWNLSKKVDSPLMEYLKNTKWLPSTKGFVYPENAFIDKDNIKEIFGETVPFVNEKELPDTIIKLLNIKTEASAQELLDFLLHQAKTKDASKQLVEKIFYALSIRELKYHILIRLRTENIILIPSKNQWVSTKKVIWKNRESILEDDFFYLESIYSNLEKFFIDTLQVKKDVDPECFAKRWLTLQENPKQDKIKQRLLIDLIYSELCQQSYPLKSKPWGKEFLEKAKIYTQEDTFEEPFEVLIPDDITLYNIFKETKDINIARFPEKSIRFEDWVNLCREMGASLLSEAVVEKLINFDESNCSEEVVFFNKNTLLMIDTWLFQELGIDDCTRYIEEGILGKIYRSSQIKYKGDLEVLYSLETHSLNKEERKNTKIFWDKGNQRFIISYDAKKKDIAHYLMKCFRNDLDEDYTGLEEWIELVLYEKNCNRLENKGWRIRPEIIVLLDKIDHPEKESKTVEDNLSDEHPNSIVDEDKTFENKNLETEDNTSISDDHISSKPHLIGDNDPPPHQINNKKTLTEFEENKDSHSLNYNHSEEIIKTFNRPGDFQKNDDFDSNQYPLKNTSRRRNKENERIKENIRNEPDPGERRKLTERSIMERPDPMTRKKFAEWYDGKCQICGHTFTERTGVNFFIASHIVHRKFSRVAGDYANALCLCAEHFAQFQHGSIETDNIVKQIKELGDECVIYTTICGKKCQIKFDQRHLIAMQELVEATSI